MHTENVTVTEISMVSSLITWTVRSITEPQEYYVLYGLDRNDLNLTTNTTRGTTNTSLTNQTYSITLQGLTMGTEYYLQVIATYGTITLYSEITSFTTLEQGTQFKVSTCAVMKMISLTPFPAAPSGPPLNFKVVARGTGLYFNWDEPAGDVTIVSYTIICEVSGDAVINATLNPVNKIVLDEFMPSTTYLCSMYASSSGGSGPSTVAVNVTTEGITLSEICYTRR